MAWATITGEVATTATKFGGDIMNDIADMFNAVDISGTNVVSIHSNVTWTFKGTAFRINDNDDSHAHIIQGGALGANVTLTLPTTTGTLGLTTVGTHDLPVLAGSMYATTNTPATGLTLTNFATNDIDEYTWDFTSTAADETVQFKIPAMPRNWDEGAITVEITWSFASGSGDVVWRVGAVAQGDNDAIDAAFTYCADKVDTAGTANQIQKVVTASFTPAGSPAAGDSLHFEVQRQGSDAADTFSGTARLHGVTIRLNTDAATAA